MSGPGGTHDSPRRHAEARALLAATLEVGSPYIERRGVLVRRLLLPRSRQHVYYEVTRENDAVVILAVWGAPRQVGKTTLLLELAASAGKQAVYAAADAPEAALPKGRRMYPSEPAVQYDLK